MSNVAPPPPPPAKKPSGVYQFFRWGFTLLAALPAVFAFQAFVSPTTKFEGTAALFAALLLLVLPVIVYYLFRLIMIVLALVFAFAD